MINFQEKENYNFDDLIEIMRILRSENGCPWDREQDHHSIRKNFIEEVYEAIEAIDLENPELLCEELGDVMLQVVFHTQMEAEAGRFDIGNVTDGICKKLILRHPHIFADVHVKNSAEVLFNWEEIKRREKGQKTYAQSMDQTAKSLPGLMRAEKLQKKAAKVGFDWPEVSGAVDKLHEELAELEDAIRKGGDIEGELGDLVFAAVNVARFFKIDTEHALEKTNNKFISRFSFIEQEAARQGKELSDLTLREMDALWDLKKASEAGKC